MHAYMYVYVCALPLSSPTTGTVFGRDESSRWRKRVQECLLRHCLEQLEIKQMAVGEKRFVGEVRAHLPGKSEVLPS